MTARRKILLRKRCPGLEYSPGSVRQAFLALDAKGGFAVPEGELSIAFLTDRGMAALHRDFLGDPTPTDVITFPGCPEMDTAGEICVSAEHAFRFAQRESLSFAREITWYLVHGYLHLAGFDDREPVAKRRMRRAEKKAMRLLETMKKMPRFHFADDQRHVPS